MSALAAFERAIAIDLQLDTVDTTNESTLDSISRASIDKRYKIFQQIFKNLSTEIVKLKVKESLVSSNYSTPSEGCDTQSSAPSVQTSLTYGEVEFFSLCDILFRLNPKVSTYTSFSPNTDILIAHFSVV